MACVDQPEQAGGENIAKFLMPGPLRVSKGLVRLLPDRSADRDFPSTEMVYYTEPVFMVDRGKKTVNALRVNE